MPFRLLIIVFRDSLSDDMHQLLSEQQISAFTEITAAQGMGESGKALDTFLWPGTNCMIFAAVGAAQAQRFVDAFTATRARLEAAQQGANIPIKLFVLPVEQLI